MENSEHELAQFLETTKYQRLATWQHRRTDEEISAFILDKLAQLEDVAF